MIRVCVAGVTGWTGRCVAEALLNAPGGRFALTGGVARKAAGQDVGTALGLPPSRVAIAATLEEALATPTDVVVDYTGPDSVKRHTFLALGRGVRVVIGTSGLTAADFAEIEVETTRRGLGVIAAGNFSITAALAKHFALLAARYVPSWEIIDYAHADKRDAPSGSTRELAEELRRVAANRQEVPAAATFGAPEARGASIAGTPVHSVRLPSFVISFETIFGLPHERLTIRHDSGTGAEPYVAGTLLAVERVMATTGLIRGLDRLLFAAA